MGSKVEGRLSRRREWLLALGSLAFCLALLGGAEAWLRWRRPAFLEDTPLASPVVYSPVYGWELRKGWRGRDRSGAPITLDADGHRAVPRPAPGLRTSGRVLMLGDSIAFGTGVGDDQTFSHVLHELDPGLEVANLAVPGYGTDQSLIRLEREGASLSPDVVVLHFCVANDLADNALPEFLYDPRRPKPFFTLEGGQLRRHDAHVRRPWHVRLASALGERSYLINALAAVGDRPDGLPPAQGHWQKRERKALRELDEVAALTARQIAQLDAVSRRAGARLVVLVHPDRGSFEGTTDLAERVLAGIGPGTRAVDLRREYRALDLAFWDLALDGVGHLNPRGHQVVARLLHRLVGEEGRDEAAGR
jgi:hypothetical protein